MVKSRLVNTTKRDFYLEFRLKYTLPRTTFFKSLFTVYTYLKISERFYVSYYRKNDSVKRMYYQSEAVDSLEILRGYPTSIF